MKKGVAMASALLGAGADTLTGGVGNDTTSYAGSSAGVNVSLAVGAINRGGDATGDVLSSIENLSGSAFNDVLTGNAVGNGLSGLAGNDTLSGAVSADTLDGGAGAGRLTGGGGNDVCVFRPTQAPGDEVTDFVGNGTAPGDQLQCIGYGTAAAGASLTQVGATDHWLINSADGTLHEDIRLIGVTSLNPSDFVFT